MRDHISTGKKGENIARQHLENNGYELLCANFKASKYEIDIIVKKQSILVFVEVKTRKSDQFGEPEDSVDYKKEEKIAEAAKQFMENYEGDFIDIRFDIVAIILKEKSHQLKHIEDAFVPKNF